MIYLGLLLAALGLSGQLVAAYNYFKSGHCLEQAGWCVMGVLAAVVQLCGGMLLYT